MLKNQFKWFTLNILRMNIHISNIDINKIKSKLIDKFFIKKKESVFIYSKFGVLEVKNDELWKLSVDESTSIVSVKIDNYDLLIDTGKWIKKELSFQLPVEHIQIRTTQSIYELNKKSLIKLVIERENDKITNILFKTDKVVDIEEIKDDIITFLSLLK